MPALGLRENLAIDYFLTQKIKKPVNSYKKPVCTNRHINIV